MAVTLHLIIDINFSKISDNQLNASFAKFQNDPPSEIDDTEKSLSMNWTLFLVMMVNFFQAVNIEIKYHNLTKY